MRVPATKAPFCSIIAIAGCAEDQHVGGFAGRELLGQRADRTEGDVDLVAARTHELARQLAHRLGHRARAEHLDGASFRLDPGFLDHGVVFHQLGLDEVGQLLRPLPNTCTPGPGSARCTSGLASIFCSGVRRARSRPRAAYPRARTCRPRRASRSPASRSRAASARSGSSGLRSLVSTASGRIFRALTCGRPVVHVRHHHLDVAGDEIGHRGRVAAVGHAHDVDAGALLERLTDDLPGAVADAVRQLAGIGFGVGDELGHRR